MNTQPPERLVLVNKCHRCPQEVPTMLVRSNKKEHVLCKECKAKRRQAMKAERLSQGGLF